MPSYLANYDKLKAKSVADIICMAVNDAFVMGGARDQKTAGKVRMMGDGSAEYTKALGLELDLDARGMGMRCQRFSMLVDDGVVKTLNIEGPGKFEVSDGDTTEAAGLETRVRRGPANGGRSGRRFHWRLTSGEPACSLVERNVRPPPSLSLKKATPDPAFNAG